MKNLYFFHGLEASPQGTKSQFLKKYYPNIIIPELAPDINKRMTVIEDLVVEPAWLIGSSMGGLSAIFFAMKNPGFVKEMILLAPAVGFFDSGFFSADDLKKIKSTYIPAGIPTTIIAGENDAVIPLSDIEAMVSRSSNSNQVKLLTVKDDHSLNRSLDLLLSLVKKMIKE